VIRQAVIAIAYSLIAFSALMGVTIAHTLLNVAVSAALYAWGPLRWAVD
jgi:hypothetical protein